jgi:hypothetical protein
MNEIALTRSALALAVITLFSLCACTTGPMNVREVHYYAVPNGENTNYYRLRVEADTKLGVAGYRSGYFPARNVDSLFGDVSSEGGAASLAVRLQIEQQINEKILSTNQAWLEEAAKPNADANLLEGLLRARRRILAYPISDGQPYKGAFEIEYNPAKGVHTRYADEKLLFILGSDPDQVVSQIANFAESDKTVLSINQLSNVLAQRVRNDIAGQQAVEQVNRGVDGLVSKQIEKARKVADNPATLPGEAIREIDTLIILLNGVYP